MFMRISTSEHEKEIKKSCSALKAKVLSQVNSLAGFSARPEPALVRFSPGRRGGTAEGPQRLSRRRPRSRVLRPDPRGLIAKIRNR